MNNPDETHLVSPTETTLLAQLAHRWLAARDGGEPVSPVELCGDRPDLLPDLNRFIKVFTAVSRAETWTVSSEGGGAARSNSPPEPEPVRVGRFEVREYLGGGAFGWVYRAFDPTLRREVALKLPRPERVRTPSERARFLNEARAAATIRHPNVVPVHEVGEDDGRPFIVMGYLRGPTLARVLADRADPFPTHQAAAVVRSLALAVQAAHDRGVVHRDLKPTNVLFDSDHGEFVITDFGLAQLTDPGEPAGPVVGMAGTPAYMPPEQARGDSEATGPRSDVYALGVVLFELLTRRTPFAGGSAVEVIARMLTAPPPSVAELRPDVPPGLDAVCSRAIAKDPAARYPSARELADALTPFATPALPVLPLSTTILPPQRAPKPRPRWVVPALVLTAAAATVGAAIAFWPPRDENRADSTPREPPPQPQPQPPPQPQAPPKDIAPPPRRGFDQVAERRAAVWVLGAKGKVEIVDPGKGAKQTPAKPATVADLPERFRVARISFTNEAVTDNNVENLGGLVGPVALDLGNAPNLTDAGLAALARIPGLTLIRISYARKITDAGVKHLAGHPSLRIVILSDTGMSADGVRSLANIPNLRELGFHGHAITDKWLEAAAGARGLTHLYAGYSNGRAGANITAAGLAHLAGLKELFVLDLDQARLKADAVKGLPALPSLNQLFLPKTAVADDDLGAVARCPRLKLLRLDDTAVTGDGMKALAKAPALESLYLDGTRFGDDGLKALAGCTTLRELSVARTRVTADGASEFGESVPQCKVTGVPKKK